MRWSPCTFRRYGCIFALTLMICHRNTEEVFITPGSHSFSGTDFPTEHPTCIKVRFFRCRDDFPS